LSSGAFQERLPHDAPADIIGSVLVAAAPTEVALIEIDFTPELVLLGADDPDSRMLRRAATRQRVLSCSSNRTGAIIYGMSERPVLADPAGSRPPRNGGNGATLAASRRLELQQFGADSRPSHPHPGMGRFDPSRSLSVAFGTALPAPKETLAAGLDALLGGQ
jgi:hypothetical protein